MNDDQSLTQVPLMCVGPATDTAVEAMANLQSTRDIELDKVPPLQAEAQQWQTQEGTKVSFIASPGRPMFDLALRFRAGSALDGPDSGLAALVLYSLDQGTEQLNAEKFAEEVEGRGAVLGTAIGNERAVVTLRCLSLPALRTSVMRLLTQMLARPAFRATDVEKIRERLNFAGSAEALQPITQMVERTKAHVFAGHPYASASTPGTIAAISEEKLRSFHQRAYSANNLDIGLVGDLTREDAEQLIDNLVRALPQQWAAQAPPPLPPRSRLIHHSQGSAPTTHALLTVPSNVTASDTVLPALTLLNAILGGGYESRLTQELRVKRSLTYTIRSVIATSDAGSLLYILWDTEPPYRDAVAALVTDMLTCLGEHGPSQAECDTAFNQHAAEMHRRLSNRARLAKALADSSHRRLPADHFATYLDKLGTLTPANLRETAQVWLKNAPEVLVTLGPDAEQLPLPQPLVVDQ
ncbi:insulinase family protein [Pseudomonas putida]|uniref:M16 family metallopeptidase n=1 Tax=Pseudomonas putida TaxID=303 RepID=UPI0018A89DF3|nr:pitrilysin family protein [Pseudomonas putida]MBF8672081.1 insulinase family protein [Pseudomonas putida]MBF8715463.1 insulinase family protein [Pseudomonas putida]